MNKEQEDLKGKEDYISPATFLCEYCTIPVLISQPATVLMYTCKGPKFQKYLGELGQSLKFTKLCRECGDHFDV